MPEFDDSQDGGSAVDPFGDSETESNLLEDAVAAASGLKRAVTKMKATSSHVKKRRDNDDLEDGGFTSISRANINAENSQVIDKYPTLKANIEVTKEKPEKALDPPPSTIIITEAPTTAADALIGQEKKLRRTNSNSGKPISEIETERLLGAGELKLKPQLQRKNSKNGSPRGSLTTEAVPAHDLANLKKLALGGSPNDPQLQPRKTVKEMASGIAAAEPSLEPRKTVKEMTNMWKQGR